MASQSSSVSLVSFSIKRRLTYRTFHPEVTKMLYAREVKYNEHLTQTTEFRPSSQMNACPRVLRISVTEPDGTDSSSDEERGPSYQGRVKKFINVIRIKPLASEENINSKGNGEDKHSSKNIVGNKRKSRGTDKAECKNESKRKKFHGVRLRPWGR